MVHLNLFPHLKVVKWLADHMRKIHSIGQNECRLCKKVIKDQHLMTAVRASLIYFFALEI